MPMSLKGRKILVGLTGGIACYKIPSLVRLLTKANADVQVIMTHSATKFITPLTMETVSGQPVAIEMFPNDEFVGTRHIDLAQKSDLFVIAPATANFMGKAAGGISDDLLTTVLTACAGPVMIAPAMNLQMWANPITQRNRQTLEQVGYTFLGPDEGEMACRDHGVGRMVEPEEIFVAIDEFFKGSKGKSKKKDLNGKRIVVTAGPTREAIDPVRFISNRSSGKMGYALAASAAALGAEVTLISGPAAITPPFGVKLKMVETTVQMARAVKREIKAADCLIMAAAPSDYSATKVSSSKIKRTASLQAIELKPTDDILKSIIGLNEKLLVVGFALETDDAVKNARTKLREKKLDLIAVNRPSPDSGFDTDTNQLTILAPGRKAVTWPLMSKIKAADKLLAMIARML